MENRIKNYKLILTTQSPIYIGSGNKISKKEYIYDEAKKTVIIPNLFKLYNFLETNNLVDKYQEYLVSKNSINSELGSWLNSQGIFEFSTFTDYEIDANSIRADRAKSEINLFVKDGQRTPYVPGSSLKGAIRTVLLVNELYGKSNLGYKQDIRSVLQRRGNSFNKEIRKIEADFYNSNKDPRDMSKDILRGMIVSDSEPISLGDMTLCKKEDMHIRKRADSGPINMLPLYRECVKPGTQLAFTLTIDNAVFQNFSAEYLMQSIENFDEMYNKCFLEAFEDKLVEPTIYLGGGTGFASKSIVYAIFGKYEGLKVVSEILRNLFREKNKNDERLGVSPHMKKCTTYKGRNYEFGRCSIKVI